MAGFWGASEQRRDPVVGLWTVRLTWRSGGERRSRPARGVVQPLTILDQRGGLLGDPCDVERSGCRGHCSPPVKHVRRGGVTRA
jgi:hypothetical protein